MSAEEIAKTAIDDFQARLIVIVVYGNQPSATCVKIQELLPLCLLGECHRPKLKLPIRYS